MTSWSGGRNILVRGEDRRTTQIDRDPLPFFATAMLQTATKSKAKSSRSPMLKASTSSTPSKATDLSTNGYFDDFIELDSPKEHTAWVYYILLKWTANRIGVSSTGINVARHPLILIGVF